MDKLLKSISSLDIVKKDTNRYIMRIIWYCNFENLGKTHNTLYKYFEKHFNIRHVYNRDLYNLSNSSCFILDFKTHKNIFEILWIN